MESTTSRLFVTPTACFPTLVIDVQPSTPPQPPKQGDHPLELKLTDDDALELIKLFRVPTADLGRWAV